MKSSTSNSSNSDNKVKASSKSSYLHAIQRLHGSNYFRFFRDYLKIMSRLDALFLQDLMDLSASSKLATRTINGKEYFLCTIEFLEKSGCIWTKQEQRPRIKSLLKNKFIHVRRLGIPPRRWVYIDYVGITEALG